MGYLGEFRLHWRALTAASIGLAVGYTFTNYVTNVFSPDLIRDLGWEKSDFALLGLIVVFAIICQPIAGRLADAFGVRRMALVGVLGAPALFLVLSQMTGPFWQFFMINIAQVILVGGTTSAVVYTRLIADEFDRAKGVALGIAACAPALLGAASAPLLSALVISYGWRTGYMAVALFTLVMGLIVLALIPKAAAGGSGRQTRNSAPVDYRELVRDSAFLIIITGTVLCNLTLTMQMTQIKILVLDKGVSASAGAFMVSLYGGGVVVGRLLCGAALDRFPAHIVSAISMAAPAIGLVILASGSPGPALVGTAVALLGLSMGAEGDVGAYLVMKYFKPETYSSVFGIVVGALSLSGALGAVLLSYTLRMTGGFEVFLFISAVAAAVGGALFMLLGRLPSQSEQPGTK